MAGDMAGDMEVVTPRRKPRGKERPQEDVAYNKAFAQVRVKVEHTRSILLVERGAIRR